jgi:type I restriction enzyme S subunit
MTTRNWPQMRVGEISEVKLGKMLSSKVREAGLVQVPYLRNENVRWGTIRFDDVKVLGLRPDEIPRYSVEPGDLLICEGGEPGRCAVYKGKPGAYAYQKALHRLRPKAGTIRAELLQYWFEHLATTGALASKIAQTTIQHLPLERIVQVEVPVPPARQQNELLRALDLHLTRIDEGVTSLARAAKSLKAYRTAVLAAACEGRLVPTEADLARRQRRSFEPADALLARILEERQARWERDQLGRAKAKGASLKDDKSRKKYQPAGAALPSERLVPEGWMMAGLSEVADIQLGQQRAPIHAAATETVPYIRAANITWRGLDLSDVKRMGFPDRARYRLERGDVLLSEASGSASEVGKPAIWRGEIPDACYQKTLIRVRAIGDGLSPEWLHLQFLADAVLGRFAAMAPGVGILHLTAERMLRWPIAVAPLEEQRRVLTEVDRLMSFADDAERSIKANLVRARELRRAVLRDAFNGGLVPPPARSRPERADKVETQPRW